MNKILLIQKIIISQDRVVEYKPDGQTRCPVCEFCGFGHVKPEIQSTRGEIRQCYCPQCCTNFRAVGLRAEELQEIAKQEAAETPKPIRRKRKRQ